MHDTPRFVGNEGVLGAFVLHRINATEVHVLYRNLEMKSVAPRGAFAWLFMSLAHHRRRATELDLASLNPHTRRDLGLMESGLAELVSRK
jgi:hypothetical protein